MPILSPVVTVTTAATLLASGGSAADLRIVCVRNDSGVDVFLGGPAVTVAAGLKLPTATTFGPIELNTGDDLYGVVAAATQPVTVFKTRS